MGKSMLTCGYMPKRGKKRIRTSLIPPCKRVRIENRGTTLNATHKIRVQGGLIGKLSAQVSEYRKAQKGFFNF